MKLKSKFVVNAMTLAATGFAMSASYAATQPTRVVDFSPVFKVKATSWRDPAFGNDGWAHNSDWGKLTAKAGKMITITLSSTVAGFHPAITVWYRGAADTAPDSYIPDHFYTQNEDFNEPGAKDESNNATIGNIVMKNVAYNYDQDGHNLRPWGTKKGLKDGVSGKMTLEFKATKAGTYMFVVGGFNPDAKVNKAIQHDVAVTVQSK
jgi:hypothetical protein